MSDRPATPVERGGLGSGPGGRALLTGLVLSVILEPFVQHYDHFGLDGVPGFYLGFTAIMALLAVVGCSLLRPLLRRGEAK